MASTLIWSAAGPVIKYTLDYIPPATFLFLRFLIISILLLPYTIFEINKQKVAIKDLTNFFLLGLFSQTSLILIFVALEYTTALDSAIISIIGGALTVYAGHYFYKEKVGFRTKIGLSIALLGTVIAILEPALSGTGNNIDISKRLMGNLIVLVNSFAWVIYVVWSKMSMGEPSKLLKKTLSFIHIKPMSKKYSPTLLVSITFYVGLITLIPLSFLELAGNPRVADFNIMNLDVNGWLGLLYMAIFSSMVAYMLHEWAIENGKITDSAIFSYLGPVFTFPIAFWLLKETPSAFLLTGGAMILAGVILAEIGSES
jgi:drug/metabolite transporter (DMT)-like permease